MSRGKNASPHLLKVQLFGRKISIYLRTSWAAPKLKLAKNNLSLRELAKSAPNLCVSISHTKHIGGYALSRRPVGFDIEPRTRQLTDKAFHRLTLIQERQWPLTPIEFWVAKEAAWKSLRGPKQPQTISQIVLSRVTVRGGRKHFTFSVIAKDRDSRVTAGKGVLLINRRTILGIASPKP